MVTFSPLSLLAGLELRDSVGLTASIGASVVVQRPGQLMASADSDDEFVADSDSSYDFNVVSSPRWADRGSTSDDGDVHRQESNTAMATSSSTAMAPSSNTAIIPAMAASFDTAPIVWKTAHSLGVFSSRKEARIQRSELDLSRSIITRLSPRLSRSSIAALMTDVVARLGFWLRRPDPEYLRWWWADLTK
ncbi:hypothetical protein PHYSODRAFT_306425 [Phytophthora sojae]|uniref:Uncharacterized protein n=1 Tax=Phytophthora sojae (strain P6497) TaxID=1094619 RepID=G5AB38_PHYSP|nr:hypothetical protein PHYSODRAFT_306425 [Phytophthora sojae]EGZ07183.1 hypothetical protein PHYSODRAFT_306425 [Phytophthora sojae]|eukprot:XP_009536749.1 hypothetical protein PHYSODRAFT_306425 [Phytophthora sojae]